MEPGNMNMAEEARSLSLRVSKLLTTRRELRAAKREMRAQIKTLERDIERVIGKLEIVADELAELWIPEEDYDVQN
jgi:hypothetical protein